MHSWYYISHYRHPGVHFFKAFFHSDRKIDHSEWGLSRENKHIFVIKIPDTPSQVANAKIPKKDMATKYANQNTKYANQNTTFVATSRTFWRTFYRLKKYGGVPGMVLCNIWSVMLQWTTSRVENKTPPCLHSVMGDREVSFFNLGSWVIKGISANLKRILDHHRSPWHITPNWSHGCTCVLFHISPDFSNSLSSKWQ